MRFSTFLMWVTRLWFADAVFLATLGGVYLAQGHVTWAVFCLGMASASVFGVWVVRRIMETS